MSTTLGINVRVSYPSIVTYRADRPQLRELLTQGVLAGVVALFVHSIIFSFFTDNYSKLFILSALYLFLWPGAAAGLVHGFLYWCYRRMFDTRFDLVARFLIALPVVASGYGVLILLYPSAQEHQVDIPLITSWAGLQLISFSVMTGSKWRPWRTFIYGVGRINSNQRLPASVVGLLLRSSLLFLVLHWLFVFVCVLQMNEELSDYVILWLVVADFLIGLMIALVNPRFWIALSLAVVINSPWVYLWFIFTIEPSYITIVLGGYLFLWCAYLVTRWRRLDPLFSSIREELRYYYLID